MLQYQNETIEAALFRLKKEYRSLADIKNSILNKLHDDFIKLDKDFIVEDVIDNNFKFSFFGLKFIIKTEISFDQESKGFSKGELNTYYLNEEKEAHILTFTFIETGVIQNNYMLPDFSWAYYKAFVNEIISYTQTNNIKFQLK